MTLQPLDDRILVELTDTFTAKTTKGGLFVPDNAKLYKHRQMRKGRIVALGETIRTDIHGVSVGDEVCFLHQAGYEVPSWPGHEHREGSLRMLKSNELEMVIPADTDVDVDGRRVEPEDDHKWWQRNFAKPHAPSDDDAPETD